MEPRVPQPIKILLVEDNPADSEFLIHTLRAAGFEPDWQRVETESAYIKLIGPHLDLILSDFQMPRFSGFRALELLQQSGLDVPFILVSGMIGEEQAVLAMKLGATDYLLKDRLARLGQAVSHALESRQLRLEQRRDEERLELQGTALETIANAVVITGPTGIIQWVNLAFTALTGYTADEVEGKTTQVLKSGKHDCDFYRQLWSTLLSGQAWYGSFINRRKDGTFYVDEQTITPVRSADGAITHFVAIMNDVTERKQTEQRLDESREQLRALAARLQTVREEQSAHIAREIHDVLGQQLTALKLDVAWLKRRAGAVNDTAVQAALTGKLTATAQLLDTAIETVQKIATDLRPGALEKLGLAAALNHEAQELAQRSGVRCGCEVTDEPLGLDPTVATGIFRIIQEALTNVVRHARATECRIKLVRDPTQWRFEVRDNGRGITAQQRAEINSLGLLGMQERARLLGGQLELEGTPGAGTVVRLILPVSLP